MQRIMDEVERVLPSECKELLYSTEVEQRETVALAFQGLLDKHREAGTLTERMETVALRVASQLGSGSDGWLQIIRRLAGGTADDRARAAKLVKNSWHHSAWAEIVANLIDAGLDEASFASLRNGLAPDSIGPDLDNQLASRVEALRPLLADPRNTVRSFAAETGKYLDTFRDY
jgi:hypothetical protein